MRWLLGLSVASSLLFGVAVHASELVYQPVNPSFGGNPFNGPNLKSLADAQNTFLPKASSPFNSNPLQNFGQTVQSALLSQIASHISDQILGENAANSGVFHIDQTQISFHRSGGVITIDILDGASGGHTQVQVPVQQF